MSKTPKDTLKEGIMAKIKDDLVIGDVDQQDVAHNYAQVIYNLKLTNLKEPAKTHIILESCDITGCIWKKGGFLEVSSEEEFPSKHERETHKK